MAVTPVNAALTVTTAGTRVQFVSSADIKPQSVYVEALGSNTGFIYIGTSTVSSTVYIARLAAGEGFSISANASGLFKTGGQGIQLSALYADASVSGEKVQVTYMYATGG